MASNPIPNSYPTLIVHATKAFDGATSIGAGIPLLINTAAAISTDRVALITAQTEYKAARSALPALALSRRTALKGAYNFCFTARDVIKFFCGREFNEAWLAAGWTNSLAVPTSYDGLYTLLLTLVGYLTANVAQQNAALGVIPANAQTILNALAATNTAVINAEALAMTKRQVRDAKYVAMRKRLSGLCKELGQRLGPLDPRWRQLGFNLPGAATVPEVPEDVVVTPLSQARLQIECEASPNATHYRFYQQRPILDPEPIYAGHATEPLFITGSLIAGQQYLVYVSAVNDGAESNLSVPVSTAALLAAAA